MVKNSPLFPTPYPDELFYSVLCRYMIRVGNSKTRSVSQELYGSRKKSNVLFSRFIDRIVSMLPPQSGFTSELFIRNTTLYPYFAPFISAERSKTFLEYMQAEEAIIEFFALGFGKQRQPRNEYFRFCKSCWSSDIEIYGEPYWHRLHQLPGIKVCHLHAESLFETPMNFLSGASSFYAASSGIIETAVPCGRFNNAVFEKFMALSADTAWLLKNGFLFGSYENTLSRYDSWFNRAGVKTFQGKTRNQELHSVLLEYYGADFLQLLNAYDERHNASWTLRMVQNPHSPTHPIYHILMTRFLAGSVQKFFEQNCETSLPFGQSPWLCHNPVCHKYLEEVIEKFEANPYKGCMHARFECPLCGMVYRRKKAMPKSEQFTRRPKVVDYGHLWNMTLRLCLVGKKMTARETSRFMKCDFYTVNHHAAKMGIIPVDGLHLLTKSKKTSKSITLEQLPLSKKELRLKYRKRWLELIQTNPGIIRSRLIDLEPVAHSWLRKNDLTWFEKNSPLVQYVSFDWATCDIETLEKVRSAIETLRMADGRPKRISRKAVLDATCCHRITNKEYLLRMPLTAAYLNENLESEENWRKRKIVWAINELYENGSRLTLSKIATKSAISSQMFKPLAAFALECLQR